MNDCITYPQVQSKLRDYFDNKFGFDELYDWAFDVILGDDIEFENEMVSEIVFLIQDDSLSVEERGELLKKYL